MTDASIIALYLKRSEQAIAESQNAYGRYCYRVAEGILNDASDSEESVNDTWLAAWDSIPPTLPQSLRAYLSTLTRRISIDRLRARRAEKRGASGHRRAGRMYPLLLERGKGRGRPGIDPRFQPLSGRSAGDRAELIRGPVLVRPAGGGDCPEIQLQAEHGADQAAPHPPPSFRLS